MIPIAHLSLSSDALPFTGHDDSQISRITFEPVLPTATAVLPYLRVVSDDLDGAVETLRDDPAADAITPISTQGTTGLFRIQWRAGKLDWFQDAIAESEVMPLGATVVSSGWDVKVHVAGEDDLSAFQAHCREQRIDAELTSVSTSSELPEERAVTPAQKKALLLADDHGYFDEPRQVTFEELADELDVSRQAFSGRMRRGMSNLVQETLGSSESREESSQ